MSKLLVALLATLSITATAQADNTPYVEVGAGYDRAVHKQVQTLEAGVKGDVNAFGLNFGKMIAGVDYAHSANEFQKYGVFIGKPFQVGKSEVGIKFGTDRVSPTTGLGGWTLNYSAYALYPVSKSASVGVEVRHVQNDVDSQRFQGTETLVKAKYAF